MACMNNAVCQSFSSGDNAVFLVAPVAAARVAHFLAAVVSKVAINIADAADGTNIYAFKLPSPYISLPTFVEWLGAMIPAKKRL
jgi:hypothetical protein